MNRIGDWIQTYTGIEFYPLDPRPDEIQIEDIAHALAMQCRFTGHTNRFYSVAEHSVMVSFLCSPKDALWGLLHDASEAYLCDVARPVKRLPLMEQYRSVEKRLQDAIAVRFGLPVAEPSSVQEADKIMLGLESRVLMTPHPTWKKWQDLAGARDLAVLRNLTIWDQEQTPVEARRAFFMRFAELYSYSGWNSDNAGQISTVGAVESGCGVGRRCEDSNLSVRFSSGNQA